MRTIYIDVLLILNLYVNWLLLRGTAGLTHTKLTSRRCIIASLLGSLTSLTILLPCTNSILMVLMKITTAAVPVGAAFGVRHKGLFLRNLCVFISVSFVFAGLCLGLCTLTGTNLLIWSGSCIYLHFSLVPLILCTALAYFLLRIFSFVRMRFFRTEESYEVIIRIGMKTVKCKGLADTGNSLCDCFTGKAVVIVSRSLLEAIPEAAQPQLLKGYRLLPYSTVSGEGLMEVFQPEETVIRSLSTGRIRKIDVLIGITEEETSAIFSPAVLHVF